MVCCNHLFHGNWRIGRRSASSKLTTNRWFYGQRDVKCIIGFIRGSANTFKQCVIRKTIYVTEIRKYTIWTGVCRCSLFWVSELDLQKEFFHHDWLISTFSLYSLTFSVVFEILETQRWNDVIACVYWIATRGLAECVWAEIDRPSIIRQLWKSA